MKVATCVCCDRTLQTHFDEVFPREADAIEMRVRHLFAAEWNVDSWGEWLCAHCLGGKLVEPDSSEHYHPGCQRPRASPTRTGA